MNEIRYIINILSSEFCETGLMENDEPNPRGKLIEELIDVINRIQLQMKYENDLRGAKNQTLNRKSKNV